MKDGVGYSSTPTVLASFNGSDGLNPIYGSLIFDAAGDLFGTTEGGGGSSNGAGEVFELVRTSDGYSSTPTVLASFDGTNGANPYGGLVIDAAGNLLGTTASLGDHGHGTVFEIEKTSDGYQSTPIVLAAFDGTNGSLAEGTLLLTSDGDLLGTAGSLFELSANARSLASADNKLSQLVQAMATYSAPSAGGRCGVFKHDGCHKRKPLANDVSCVVVGSTCWS